MESEDTQAPKAKPRNPLAHVIFHHFLFACVPMGPGMRWLGRADCDGHHRPVAVACDVMKVAATTRPFSQRLACQLLCNRFSKLEGTLWTPEIFQSRAS